MPRCFFVNCVFGLSCSLELIFLYQLHGNFTAMFSPQEPWQCFEISVSFLRQTKRQLFDSCVVLCLVLLLRCCSSSTGESHFIQIWLIRNWCYPKYVQNLISISLVLILILNSNLSQFELSSPDCFHLVWIKRDPPVCILADPPCYIETSRLNQPFEAQQF